MFNKFFTAIVSAVLISGCLHANYEKTTDTNFPPATNPAQVIYPVDLHRFEYCDVIQLGSLDMAGNSFVSPTDLVLNATRIAARKGATHLLVIEEQNMNRTDTGEGHVKPSVNYFALRINCDK